jgi:capsular polysaccharide export protein
LYGAFRRVLVDRCLVRGGLASEMAVRMLIEGIVRRLCGEEIRVTETVAEPVLAE